MIKKIGFYSLILFTMIVFGCDRNEPKSSGHLVIIGGGKRPLSVMKKFVDLSGGLKAKIAIIPMASGYYEEVGPEYEDEFKQLGVAEARAFYIHSKEEADQDSLIRKLFGYTGVFFGGGNQNKLTDIFLGSKTLDFLLNQYHNGLVIGGTSAGAAIMSSIMITGDGNWNVLMRDSVKTAPGFGLVDQAVIDQHFFKRRRINRLLNVVIQNKIKGVGIDESTAVWVHDGNQMNVLGESVVLVVDPKNVETENNPDNGLLTAKKLFLSVYKSGDTFNL